MNAPARIYVTLSPRIRKMLEFCAGLDGSAPASYAANLLSSALMQEIEKSPAMNERWTELEREAIQMESWDGPRIPSFDNLVEVARSRNSRTGMDSWFMAGSNPTDYELGVDNTETFQGKNSGYLRSRRPGAEGFGTMMQMFKADIYRNKRMSFSAVVKSVDVENWAGLWMRIDGPSERTLGFDNMQNRPIKGTTDWQRYVVVLDVPTESINIAFGVLLDGPGQVCLSDVQFNEVGLDVPTTNMSATKVAQPGNLDFTA